MDEVAEVPLVPGDSSLNEGSKPTNECPRLALLALLQHLHGLSAVPLTLAVIRPPPGLFGASGALVTVLRHMTASSTTSDTPSTPIAATSASNNIKHLLVHQRGGARGRLPVGVLRAVLRLEDGVWAAIKAEEKAYAARNGTSAATPQELLLWLTHLALQTDLLMLAWSLESLAQPPLTPEMALFLWGQVVARCRETRVRVEKQSAGGLSQSVVRRQRVWGPPEWPEEEEDGITSGANVDGD